jgi:ferric-chelate reductase [NAD(P)H]
MAGRSLDDVTYGLYIISTAWDGKLNGLIVNTVIQVSSAPEKILVCINKNSMTHDMISRSHFFSVSVLDQEATMKFLGPWGFRSGRDVDKFIGVNYKIGVTGAPIILDNTLSYMEVSLYGTLDVESHTIFIGKIVASEKLRDGEPLTYRYYKEVKGGRASKYAPTFNDWSLLEKMEAKKPDGE